MPHGTGCTVLAAPEATHTIGLVTSPTVTACGGCRPASDDTAMRHLHVMLELNNFLPMLSDTKTGTSQRKRGGFFPQIDAIVLNHKYPLWPYEAL